MERRLEITLECPLHWFKIWPVESFLWPFQNQLYFPQLKVHFVLIGHSNTQHVWTTILFIIGSWTSQVLSQRPQVQSLPAGSSMPECTFRQKQL